MGNGVNVLLFHHALGLTEGVRGFADTLQEAGHSVETPDLYGGVVFDDLDLGVAHAQDLGINTLLDVGTAIAGRDQAPTVYAGFSLGGLIAHKLAQTQPNAAGTLLYHYGDVEVTAFGDDWPAGVPVDLHITEGDPYGNERLLASFLRVARESATANLYTYPGSGHLFCDPGSPDYDATSDAAVRRRTLTFLDAIG